MNICEIYRGILNFFAFFCRLENKNFMVKGYILEFVTV